MVEFFKPKKFLKKALKMLSEKKLNELISYLEVYPKAGDVIPKSEGLRKIRWAKDNTGKSGGVRIIYYFFDENDGIIAFLSIYEKSDKSDLSNSDIKELAIFVKLLKSKIKILMEDLKNE